MTIEMIIGAAVVVLLIAMAVKHRSKPVDMNHKAPNVHNEVSKTPNGPKTAADKPAAKTTKKKTTKKKTTKKVAAPKKVAATPEVDLNKMTKDQLEAYAKETFNVDVDKRKKKADLVKEIGSLK